MPHNCKVLILHCMDFRFHTAIREFLLSQGLKDQYDLVSLAGAAKGLADKDAVSTEIILKQIDISKRLHGISEIYLINHMDCGAYGGHKAFASMQAEHDKQFSDMEEAKKVINEKFPDLTVKEVLAKIVECGQGNKIEFEM